MNDFSARDIAHVLHPISNIASHRDNDVLALERGEGIYSIDVKGTKLLEGCAGAWCLSLGYGEEELVRVAAEQMRKLAYAPGFYNRATQPAVDLAEKLKELAPFDASKVFFTSSGSEANDSQVRLLWYYNNLRGKPEKKKIISRWGAYHGTSGIAASLTGLSAFHKDFDAPGEFVRHAACPHYYRHGLAGESEEDFVERLARELDELIQCEDPDTIAGMIIDPVMGGGGVLVPPDSYLRRVQEVLGQYDIRIISDEVICGFGRTGEQWGCDTYGFIPHSITVAKQLSAAYLPIGGVVLDGEMYDAVVEGSRRHGVFGHGFTYSGHPVAAAVALRTLEIYEERDILNRVRGLSGQFDARLEELLQHPLVGEVQSAGLLGAVELVADKETKRPHDSALHVGAYCLGACQRNGLIIRTTADRMLFCPPMVITEAELDLMFEMFAAALDETAEWLAAETSAA
jgi:4-aminobutyrate--pyruvate transaminase